MHLQKVIAVIQSPTEERIQDLLDDESCVFWVDWREEDDAIAEYCESVLQTGQLSGECVEADSNEGFEVHLKFKNRRIKVPLRYNVGDRHLTLCALNRVLAP